MRGEREDAGDLGEIILTISVTCDERGEVVVRCDFETRVPSLLLCDSHALTSAAARIRGVSSWLFMGVARAFLKRTSDRWCN